MGQQQLFLTLGAVVLFGIVTISVNVNIARNTEAVYDQQIVAYAANLGQRFIDEAKTRAFDEASILAVPTSIPGNFKPPGSMGTEGGEVYPNIDDVDDFHGYTSTVSTDMGDMNVSIVVYYVTATDLDTDVGGSGKTRYKKMTVTVTCSQLPAPVVVTYVFAFQKNEN
jgi:hypothetical protein